MTYNPNIPLSSDIPSQSQAQLLTNFQQLNSIFDVDHVPFNDATAANRGKHDKSTYIAGSDPATAAGELAVYSKTVSGTPQLFVRQASNGTVIPMTSGTIVASTPGSTCLPGGVGLKWGAFTASGSSVTVNYVNAFVSSTFSVCIGFSNPVAQACTWRVSSNSASGFTLAFSGLSGTGAFTYIATGV